MTNSRHLFMSLSLYLLFFSCSPVTRMPDSNFIYTTINGPRNLAFSGYLQYEKNRYWAIGSSNFFGFNEFWISSSTDNINWSKPHFTGIPAGYAQYVCSLKYDTLIIKELWQNQKNEDWYAYHRNEHLSNKQEFKVSITDLKLDSDRDGLLDIAEKILLTNPQYSDTDNDGKADGFDQNPLAAPSTKLTVHERLHKYIIELELDLFSDQLLLVEQLNSKPIEYKRKEGFVLSLGTKEIDKYLDTHGYGVPILSTAIKDTLRKYKVSFEYFVSPEDAWGYENIYDWDRELKKWIKGEELSYWEAEWSGLPPLLQINIQE